MNNFKSIGTSSISSSVAAPTTIYTANNGTPVNSVLLQADVANTGTARITVTLLFVDSDAGSTYHIIKDAEVPVGGTVQIVNGQKIVLNGDDQIQVYGSDTTADVLLSFIEDVP